MADTQQLNLPLLSASQAQKHVTVNEALIRLDGMVQLRLQSVTDTIPPAVFSEADAYGVPAGATGLWAGQEGRIAIAVNGGWDFIDPRIGFQAYVIDAGAAAIFDGMDWRIGGLTFTPNRAGLNVSSVEIDQPITSGSSVTTAPIIPERAIVFGVTGVITAAITGASAWRIGVTGEDQRYGSGLSTGVGSWLSGPSTPLVYWAPTPLVISSEDNDFSGGNLRLAVHFATLSIPAGP
ncbi:MAG: DUF2793 domain-containing protein [Pseudomonadota bacterium]